MKKLFAARSRLLVARGKKLIDVEIEDLDEAALEKLVIGPSGNLRAPTLLRGKRVMVGFHEDGYAAFFGR